MHLLNIHRVRGEKNRKESCKKITEYFHLKCFLSNSLCFHCSMVESEDQVRCHVREGSLIRSSETVIFFAGTCTLLTNNEW